MKKATNGTSSTAVLDLGPVGGSLAFFILPNNTVGANGGGGCAKQNPPGSSSGTGTSYGPCFQCGTKGHFRRACLLLLQASK